MIIGFTGTRNGMSKKQYKEVIIYLQKLLDSNVKLEFAIHGGCIGADDEFHIIATSYFEKINIYMGHSKDGNSLSNKNFSIGNIRKSKPYLERNKDIVFDCDILLACPFDNNQKGGTWYTINYAKKMNKQVIIFER